MTDKSVNNPGDMESESSFDSAGKQKSFRRLITRFTEKTSMQGPPYIRMAKFWWAKLIWAVLLLGAVAVMVLHLWYLFEQWYEWPKTTTISLGFDDLSFPQVTICNTNVLHKTRFHKFESAKELKMLVKDLKPENRVPQQFDDNYDPETGINDPNGGPNQGVTKPSGSQRDQTQPGGSHKGMTTPSGSHQTVTKPSGPHQDVTTQSWDRHGGPTPDGNKGPPENVSSPGGKQQSNKGKQQTNTTEGVTQPLVSTTQNNETPRRTQSRPGREVTRSGKQSGQGKEGQTWPGPKTDDSQPESGTRKKRSGSSYDSFNVSDYYKGYKNYEEDLRRKNDLDTPMDSRTIIENVFRELYMDINKKNRGMMGHQIDDMLVGCTFNGRKCSSDMFTLHQTAEYGNCWTIASDRFSVREAGPRGGLTVVLFLQTSEYLKGLATGYGARVQFQERDTYPFPFDEGVFISGATETSLGLKFRTITRLGGKYGKCNDGHEFKSLYNLTYTRRACQSFCTITSIIKTCKCFDDHWEEFAFKKNDTLKPCRSESEQKCRLGILKQDSNSALSCQCTNPCQEVEYLKSVSSRQWPTDEYARVLLGWLCDKDPSTCRSLRGHLDDIWTIKNNFVRLNIYYEDLNFENITETAQIELQQFLSDIGGAFGLWIGLSVLSLCEVIQLFIELFDYGLHKATRGQQDATGHKDNNITVSTEFSPNSEKNIETKLPRIVLDPRDRFPPHMRDESPFRERSNTTGRYSDDSAHAYKGKHNGDYYKRSPDIRQSRDRSLHGSSPDLLYSSERDDNRRHKRKHAHESPRHARRHIDRHDGYPEFRDDYGIDRRKMMY